MKHNESDTLIKIMLDKKAEENNKIDLEAYALGIKDAFKFVSESKNKTK